MKNGVWYGLNMLSATLTFAQTHDCDITWQYVDWGNNINFIFMRDQNQEGGTSTPGKRPGCSEHVGDSPKNWMPSLDTIVPSPWFREVHHHQRPLQQTLGRGLGTWWRGWTRWNWWTLKSMTDPGISCISNCPIYIYIYIYKKYNIIWYNII